MGIDDPLSFCSTMGVFLSTAPFRMGGAVIIFDFTREGCGADRHVSSGKIHEKGWPNEQFYRFLERVKEIEGFSYKDYI